MIREWDEFSFDDPEPRWDRKIGKATLASLARTCRAFHEPALDALWMKLDLLDPVIQLLPRRMWTKRYHPLLIRVFMREKHWLTFRKYASRVKSVRAPCWSLHSSVQYNIILALAKPLYPSYQI
ncbi:hypothetical protein F5I97DRAFT_1949410 [Phlebopus sp. FC_14]|nr:hypothetical protein F5I97DRAFT_1949410 [Phlebopus sp. FC_14]